MSPEDQEDAMNILRNIETLEDFEEHKTVIVDVLMDQFREFVGALRALTDGSQSPEQIETRMTALEAERDKLEQEVGAELERIAKIPGAEAAAESLQGELTKQMGSLAQEMAQVMMQLMANVMGGMFGGEGMEGEMTESAGFNFTDEEVENYEPAEGVTFEVLEFVRSITPEDDHEAKAKELVGLMEKMYKEELEKAKELKEADLSPEELREKVLNLQQRQMYLMAQMEPEMERLDQEEDSYYGDGIEEEMTGRIEPVMNEFFQIIADLNVKYMMLTDEGEPSEPKEEVWCPECEHQIYEDDNNWCSYCGLHLEDWYEGRVKLNMLYSLYQARTLEAFNEIKDGLIEDLIKEMEYDIMDLEPLDEPEWINESQERVEEYDVKHQALKKELDLHFNRLRELPDAKDAIDEFEKELWEKIQEKYDERGGHLERIKKAADWHKD